MYLDVDMDTFEFKENASGYRTGYSKSKSIWMLSGYGQLFAQLYPVDSFISTTKLCEIGPPDIHCHCFTKTWLLLPLLLPLTVPCNYHYHYYVLSLLLLLLLLLLLVKLRLLYCHPPQLRPVTPGL